MTRTTSRPTRPTATTTCCASAWAATRTTPTASASTARATTSRRPRRCGLFSELPEACDNTLAIAERIQPYDEVFTHVDRMPQFDVLEGETQESWLRKKVTDGIRIRYGENPSDEVLERVETELKVIEPLGFSSYFLVVSDICDTARSMGVAVGPGRGSAAVLIIAYLTGIIQIDFLEHGLLFERFLNPERISPPDIDLDFDDRKRDKVIEYVTHGGRRGLHQPGQHLRHQSRRRPQKDAERISATPSAWATRSPRRCPPM